MAGLLDAGVIDWTGLIQVEARDALPPRRATACVHARRGASGGRAPGGRSRRPREIVLTQDDVRQVQLAKGAIASGVMMLQHVAGVPGSRRRRADAGGRVRQLRVGRERPAHRAHPAPCPRARSVTWATPPRWAPSCASLSEPERARAERGRRAASSTSRWPRIPDFEQIFVDCMNFPRQRDEPPTTTLRAIPRDVAAPRWAPSRTRSTRAGSWRTRRHSASATPRYFDTLAGTGRSPTRSSPCATSGRSRWRMRAKAIAAELAPLGVHATHHLIIHRAPRAGDRADRARGSRRAAAPRRHAGRRPLQTVDAAGDR